MDAIRVRWSERRHSCWDRRERGHFVMPMSVARKYVIICFYTADNAYRTHAERLRVSLAKFNVPHKLTAISSEEGWEQTCAKKANFIREEWCQSEVPVVWIDADATLESEPLLFDTIDADFAVHKWDGWQFGGGTVYFAKTKMAKTLLDRWCVRCSADPMTWDQTHLQSAWCDVAARGGLRTYWLPRSYLQVFDRPEHEPAVIRHLQASRQSQTKRQWLGLLQCNPRGVALRRKSEPWRTAEEIFWIEEGMRYIKSEIGFDYPEGFDVGSALHAAID